MKSIKKLLSLSKKKNIAVDLDDETLNNISHLCLNAYEIDHTTCSERFNQLDEFVKIAEQAVEEKSYPWQGAANVKYPILTTSAMQFNARAYPALVPTGKIVKARYFGSDTDGSKHDRSERVTAHMSYQVTYGIRDWCEEMDSLLMRLPIVASIYKKTYWDHKDQEVKSCTIGPKNIVVNNDTTKTIETCPRITEIIYKYPYEIRQNIDSGIWIDHEIEYSDEDQEKPVEILEQHCLISLDDSKDKEPYIVTIDKDSKKIYRIKACYDEDTIFVDLGGEIKSLGRIRRDIDRKNVDIRKKNQIAMFAAREANAEAPISIKEIAFNVDNLEGSHIERIQYYTEYWFLPSFNGKYLKAGLADLIAALSATVDTNINQLLDAGSLSNLQSGFRMKVGKGASGTIRLGPGEFPEIETGGIPLRDAIMNLDFKGPSPVLFQLLGMMIEATRDITGVKDIMVGDAPQGETATTTMIKREEGLRVFTAIYKRIYRAMSREFKKIYDMNRRNLSQEQYFRFGDLETYVQKEDYEDDSLDIMPVADPNESTMQDRMLKAKALLELMADPSANQEEIKKNYIMAMGFNEEEYKRFFPGAPPAQPGPMELKLMAEIEQTRVLTAKYAAETEKVQKEISLVYASIVEKIANAEAKEAGTQIESYRAIADSFNQSKEIEQNESQEMEQEQDEDNSVGTGVPGMAGESGDEMGQEEVVNPNDQLGTGEPEDDEQGLQMPGRTGLDNSQEAGVY